MWSCIGYSSRVFQQGLVVFRLWACNWREWNHSCSVSHQVPQRQNRLSPPSFRPLPSIFFICSFLSFLRKYASVAKKHGKNTSPSLFHKHRLIILQKFSWNDVSSLLTPQCMSLHTGAWHQNFSRETFQLIRQVSRVQTVSQSCVHQSRFSSAHL